MSARVMTRGLRRRIATLLLASLMEMALAVLTHGPHRASVAVVSFGVSARDGQMGWLVIAAHMTEVLVLPPLIIACAIVCMMHVIANSASQSASRGR